MEAQEYWCGLPMTSPAEIPHAGIKTGSPALQKDSLPAKLPTHSSIQTSRIP